MHFHKFLQRETMKISSQIEAFAKHVHLYSGKQEEQNQEEISNLNFIPILNGLSLNASLNNLNLKH